MPNRNIRAAFGLAALLALLASGCGSSQSTTATGATSASGPITLRQCTGEKLDRSVTYDDVPRRIFTLDPQSAEFLVALGLGDRIVGTWGMYSAKEMRSTPEYAAALRRIKVIGDDKTWPPPVEQIASTRPDIVVSIYRLNIPGYLDAERLQDDLGITTYGFTSTCHQDGPMRTLDPVFADITNLGRIFGVEDRAKTLIARMNAQLAQARALTAGRPRESVWQYAGENPPYPATGHGTANAIITLAGGRNVFEDVPGAYAKVSWEQVVKRAPHVVWLQTDAGPGFIAAAAGIRKATVKNPGLADVPGVKGKRFVVLPYTTAGVQNVHNAQAVLQFAKALSKLGDGS